MQRRLFCKCLPLGTYADDGSGIALGESVGGATSRMDKMSAWRFYVPPEALMQGVLVDQKGKRICSEDLYGGKQGAIMVAKAGGFAKLIIDSKTYEEAKSHFKDQLRRLPEAGHDPDAAPRPQEGELTRGAGPQDQACPRRDSRRP